MFVIRNLSYLGSRILIIRMGKAPPFFGDEVGPSFLCQFWVNHIPILVFLDAILLCACSLLKGQDQYDLWLKILPIKLSFNQT